MRCAQPFPAATSHAPGPRQRRTSWQNTMYTPHLMCSEPSNTHRHAYPWPLHHGRRQACSRIVRLEQRVLGLNVHIKLALVCYGNPLSARTPFPLRRKAPLRPAGKGNYLISCSSNRTRPLNSGWQMPIRHEPSASSAAPVCKTHKIPCRMARGSLNTDLLPPWPLGVSGRRGACRFHCLLVVSISPVCRQQAKKSGNFPSSRRFRRAIMNFDTHVPIFPTTVLFCGHRCEPQFYPHTSTVSWCRYDVYPLQGCGYSPGFR